MTKPNLYPCSYIGSIEPFATPRRGWLGKTPMGSDYMEQVEERARRMKAASREPEQPTESRQLFLPGFKS